MIVRLPDLTNYLQSIVDTIRDPILVLDKNLRVVSANRSFYRTFSVPVNETEGCLIYELGDGQWNIPALSHLLENILSTNSSFEDFEVAHDFPDIGHKIMLLNARKLYRPGNHTEMILLAIEDVTKRRTAEMAADAAKQQLQQAYEREKKIATALQLPLSVEIKEDAFPGMSIATVFEPMSSEADIGGDFFDVFALPRNHVICAVGDASGKGLAAAARAMQVKDVLRAFALEYPHSAASVAARLNDYVHETQNIEDAPGGMPTMFVCLSLVMLDTETGEASAVSAGSEPPLILCADGTTQTVQASGMPLGVESQGIYNVATFQLDPGDTLMLLTDGLTEARNKQRQFLDHTGVLDLAQQAKNAATLREMAKQVLRGAKDYSGGTFRDDACLLLVRRE